jgi:hypothetical protein
VAVSCATWKRDSWREFPGDSVSASLPSPSAAAFKRVSLD